MPEDYRVGLHAILNAFKQYEAGQDDAAKATLQVIGLQSPFLEWKLTLRGLMAYTANDDARAIENWQRLSPTRLPAKFVSSLHSSIDASQRTGQTAEDQKRLAKASDHLSNNPIIKLLKELQPYLGRDMPMTSARNTDAKPSDVKTTSAASGDIIFSCLSFPKRSYDADVKRAQLRKVTEVS